MFMEIDDVAVSKHIWEKVKAGDKEAMEHLKNVLNGLELYTHILSAPQDFIHVSIRELKEFGVLEVVRLNTRAFVEKTATFFNENGDERLIHYRSRTDEVA